MAVHEDGDTGRADRGGDPPNGGKAWYLLANDEGHGFRKKSNRDFYNWSMFLFLEEHLLK